MIQDDSPSDNWEGVYTCEASIDDRLLSWPVKLVSVPEPALPPADLRLKAFTYFFPTQTRAIILGQDPYPARGKANGLAFGISQHWEGEVIRSSFSNIMYEVQRHNNFALDSIAPGSFRQWATLEGWAKQGVLLTNTRLSVAEGRPLSHAGMGWEQYVGLAVQAAISAGDPILVAFGSEARLFYEKQLKVCGRSAEEYKEQGKLLCYSHPCRYSASRETKHSKRFIGSNCFSEINQSLINQGRSPIQWWET